MDASGWVQNQGIEEFAGPLDLMWTLYFAPICQLDVIAVIPFIFLIGVLASHTAPTSAIVYLSLIRILRMVRLVSVSKVSRV